MNSVLAIFAHPDDIEFVAAGTLLLLRRAGWHVHYCNLANGCCGSTNTDRNQTAAIRLAESQNAANRLGATFYPPICDDLDVFYNRENLAKVAAIVRTARPSIVLTHAPVDYMEDHMETCRLAVSAAFTKGIPNFVTTPEATSYDGEIAIYHAQPHGNCNPLGEIVVPDFAVAIGAVMQEKIAMLECHVSQQAWLQSTQKMNSYLQTMVDLSAQVARLVNSPAQFAEGWRRHLHLGFGSAEYAPMETALSSFNCMWYAAET